MAGRVGAGACRAGWECGQFVFVCLSAHSRKPTDRQTDKPPLCPTVCLRTLENGPTDKPALSPSAHPGAIGHGQADKSALSPDTAMCKTCECGDSEVSRRRTPAGNPQSRPQAPGATAGLVELATRNDIPACARPIPSPSAARPWRPDPAGPNRAVRRPRWPVPAAGVSPRRRWSSGSVRA
jgi:hypothetical protein